MKIFVVNSGSSSLKYQLFDMNTEPSSQRAFVNGSGGRAPNAYARIERKT